MKRQDITQPKLDILFVHMGLMKAVCFFKVFWVYRENNKFKEVSFIVLLIKELRFKWDKKEPWVIDIPFFSLAEKESIFLKGASGSGKSSLLSLLAGINKPNEGQLSILGTELTALKSYQRDRFRADHIGYIFQQFNLLPYLSVLDNITLPCHFSKRRKAKVIRKDKTGQTLNKEAKRLLDALALPKNIDKKPVTSLSIGQQQRVAAARALIGKPALLLADEPTSALDTDARQAFIYLLMKETELAGSNLIFVSHDKGLESFFDRSLSLTDLNKAPYQITEK